MLTVDLKSFLVALQCRLKGQNVQDRRKTPPADTEFSEAFITDQLLAFDLNGILVLHRTSLKAVRRAEPFSFRRCSVGWPPGKPRRRMGSGVSER